MKTRRMWTAVAAAGVAASMALAGCAATPAPEAGGDDAAAPVTVRLAVLAPGSLQWLHAIAEDQGFYADHGVVIEAIQVQNSSALVQAVASGSADAGIALGDNVIRAVDEGADVVITGALFQRPALRLYGAKGVADISDLEGAQITAGAVEGGTLDLLLYMLQEADVDPTSVTPLALPNSRDRVVAMENGQVQGALLIPPFDTLATDGGATLLANYDDYYVQTPAIVGGAWAKANPEAARGFTQGLADAARFVYDPANEADAVRILSEYAAVDETAAQAAYDFMVGEEIFSPDLSIPEDGLRNIVAVSAAVKGEKMGDFDPSKYVDTQFLK